MIKKRAVFAAALAVLVILAVIASLPNKGTDSGRVQLADFKSDDLKGIDFISEEESWGIEYNGEWRVKDSDKTEPVALEMLLDAILRFDAQLIAENSDEAEKYGIDENSVRVEYQEKSGKKTVFVIGDKTPPETEYYLMDEENRIYSVYSSVGDGFKYRKYRVEDSFIFGKEYDEISRIEVDGEPPFSLINRQSAWSFESGNHTEEISVEDIRSTVTRHFGGMYSLERLNGTAENNAECGFGEGAETCAVTVTDMRGNRDTIYIGKETDNGVYIKLNNNDEIYRVIKDYFEFIKLYREGVY